MIETKDLSKQFGAFWAVEGVTLSVGAGQILALLGQNGAGKTTTVRMLTALLRPSRGSATVAGLDVVRRADEVRASVGVLTEQHGLYVRMTANEYLDFFGRLHRLDADGRKARSKYLLEYFGLAPFASQRIGEYSKGMRQKLALARALMHGPPVLLLDEPTSAMDPESARLVRDEIARLKTANRTIVICTHNLAEAEALADFVAIMYRGRILDSGMLSDLKRRVLGVTEYEARLASPWSEDGLALPDGVRLTWRDASALRFTIEDPGIANPRLVQKLAASRAPVLAFQEVPRTLEHVYLKVMERAQSSGQHAFRD
jgi:ABC-2 type transport system ATP-binding protein